MRARADGYPEVLPGPSLRFPRDHGSHPAYRTEWWYVTGWVRTRDGEPFGVQVTFFRNRPRVAEHIPGNFAPRQLVFAHAALAEPAHGRLRHDQRASRAMFDLAGADETTTRTWIGDWSLALEGERYVARIAARDFSLDLAFDATQPILLQGQQGYSRKGPELRQASWYYSRPQLAVRGPHRRRRPRARRRGARVARSRVVERGDGASTPPGGTGSASISTTAAR